MKKFEKVVVGGCIILLGGIAWADEKGLKQEPKVEYSADEYLETEQLTIKGKIYCTANKMRREQEMGVIMIIRKDKGVVWSLMPEQKMYTETNLEEGKEDAISLKGYKIEQSAVGEEVIDGIKTTKNKLIMTDPKGNKFG